MDGQVSPRGTNLPVAPSLGRYINDLKSQFAGILTEIQGLQAQEDRVRHQLGNEIRRRDQLRGSSASGPTAPSLPPAEVAAAEEHVEQLRDELRSVRERLAGAERERTRLQTEVDELESMNVEITDRVELEFQRAEFERRRYEHSDATVRSLRATVAALEERLAVHEADVTPRSDEAGDDADVDAGDGEARPRSRSFWRKG